MRKIVIIGFAAGLLAAALPAQASNSNANANHTDANARSQPQANGAPPPNRQICVRDSRSETRIPRQVCHTAAEWRSLEGEVPSEQ